MCFIVGGYFGVYVCGMCNFYGECLGFFVEWVGKCLGGLVELCVLVGGL